MAIKEITKLVRNAFRMFGLDIHRAVGFHAEYEKNKFVWLKELNINTMLDIGANTGQFALQINESLPSVEIYSFEPLKSVYPQLLKKTGEIKNFRAFNMALGDFNGTTKMYRNASSLSSSLLEMANLHKEAYPYTANTSEEEIVVKKLDDVVRDENIRLEPEILIKLDVQGYEDRVIEGGINTFKNTRVVIIEVSFQELYKGQMLFGWIYERFTDLGFKYKGNINVFLHPKTGLPLFGDAIFTRE